MHIDLEHNYTPDEVAQILNVKRDTVKEWYQEGKLGYTKLGYRTVRILGQDLMQFISSRREERNFVTRVKTQL